MPRKLWFRSKKQGGRWTKWHRSKGWPVYGAMCGRPEPATSDLLKKPMVKVIAGTEKYDDPVEVERRSADPPREDACKRCWKRANPSFVTSLKKGRSLARDIERFLKLFK